MPTPRYDPLNPLDNKENISAFPELGKRESNLPVLPGEPRLAELFAGPADVGAAGFALAQIPPQGRVLWVQERMVQTETGRPCGEGLARFGVDPGRLMLACARTAADVLWTMEEGLKCLALTAIAGEIWGNPKAMDFTATKRLALRAERQGVHIFLIRFGGAPNLSAARERWRISSRPSLPDPFDPAAPGLPRWQAELFRARGRPPGKWEARYDGAAHRLHLAPPLPDPEVEEAPGDRTSGRPAGSVLRLASR